MISTYDLLHPFGMLITLVSSALNGVASAVAGVISAVIAPLFGVGFLIYMCLIGFNYFRGTEDSPFGDLIYRMIGASLVISIAFSAGKYAAIVLPIITNLGGDIGVKIASVLPSASTQGASTSAGAVINTLFDGYVQIMKDYFKEAATFGWYEPGAIITTLVLGSFLFISIIPLCIGGTLLIIVANIGLTVVAMLGPIFIGFLLFPATRQYFSSWLNTAFSYVLIPIIVAVFVAISVNICQRVLLSANYVTGTLLDIPVVLSICVCNLLLAYALRYVSSLASSLSAGGINIGGVGGIGSAIRGAAGMGRDIRGLKELSKAFQRTPKPKPGGSISKNKPG
jgi:type IV secretion system protein VirB6